MKKDLSYYKNLNYQIILRQDEDNGEVYYVAEIPDLPGCGAHGTNQIEALERLEEAKELWIFARMKRNLPIPEPSSEDDFSGKILLRIPCRLHMELSRQAKNNGLSLNQSIRKKIESVLSMEVLQKEISELRAKIDELCLRNVHATSDAWGSSLWIQGMPITLTIVDSKILDPLKIKPLELP
jgi:antitoxin HicB